MAKKGDFFYTVRGDIRKKVTDRVNRDVASTKQEIVDYIVTEVKKHKVSQELASKSDSSFFESPKGSLFGLMGFYAGSNPVGRLLAYLRSRDAFRTRYAKPFGNLDVRLEGPTDESMAANEIVVPEWSDGRSWPEMLESGITGLNRFFSKKGYGERSQEGYQFNKSFKGRPETLEGIDYLSGIFRKANKRFRTILKRKLSS